MVAGAPRSTSGAGSATLPSSRWPFSSSAMIVRPTATAVPFSVCTWRGRAALGPVADVQAAGLEVGRVRASRSARGSGSWPGSHASQSYFLAAEAPRSPTAMFTTR